ncbi:MAG: hypothetical protein H7268_00940 [Sandarakinorhabdus sp.]|nr:hypothetical protein [Sandarakinorhabdus sp.]
MRRLHAGIAALLGIIAARPALADEMSAPAFDLSGAVAVVSDYRFRGVSQTNSGFAVQGGLNLAHVSGFYAGLWGSNLAGWGTFGGPNLELDIIGGYKRPLGAGSIDVGITWYNYPGGAAKTSFVEPYAKLAGTVGPVGLTAGVAYAPSQTALGNWSNHPDSRVGSKGDNLYLWGDAGFAVIGTPVTVKAHLGYSHGNPGLGPNGTSVAPTGSYWDWLIGADYVVGPVTLGIAYVDTDISANGAAFARLQPNFSKGQVAGGNPISNGRVVFSVTAAF